MLYSAGPRFQSEVARRRPLSEGHAGKRQAIYDKVNESHTYTTTELTTTLFLVHSALHRVYPATGLADIYTATTIAFR
jgi:hypothetical protein